MNICEMCKCVFAVAGAASQRLCRRCVAHCKKLEEQRRRQREWVQAQFEQHAAQLSVTAKVRLGKYTDFPGSVSGAYRLVPGDATAEAELILLDLYDELTPQEWLALGELGEHGEGSEAGEAGTEGGEALP